MQEEQRTHLIELSKIHQSRLNQLEIHDAHMGINSPPEVKNEMQYIRTELIQIEKLLNAGAYFQSQVIPPNQPELTLDITARRSTLSEGQMTILNYIHKRSYHQTFVTQDEIEAVFSRYSEGELYYRLEHLRLLGFIDKERIKYDNSVERFLYRVSRVYFDTYGNNL